MKQFFSFLKNLRQFGVEYTSGRYYGTAYQGVFDDVVDPQAQSRAKVCSKVVVNRDEALTLWAYPVSPYAGKDKGLIMPPDAGDAAWVWFDHGDKTQPRYLGSWWLNDDTEADPKSADKSFLPSEFRPEKDKPPTARGFKSKHGHGWLTEDDEEAGRKFWIWTGEQEEEGADSTKHHELIFDDKDEFVLVNSYGKDNGDNPRFQHQLRFDDKDEFMLLKSAGDSDADYHYLEFQDTDGYVRLQTHDKHFLVFEDQSKLIQISTDGKFTTRWDEQGKKIETMTAAGQKLVMDDNLTANELATVSGQSFKQEQAGTTILDPVGKVDITATSASTHTYAAALTRTVGGAFTDTIGQALTVTVAQATTWLGQAFSWTGTTFTWIGTVISMTGTAVTITAPAVQIASANVLAGSGSNQPLVNLTGSIKYNTHTHTVVGALPGFALPTSGTMIPFVDTTVALLGA